MKVNIGPMPPPIGGVSTHLFRAKDILREAVVQSNQKPWSFLIQVMDIKGSVIYLHDFSRKSMIFIFVKICFFNRGCSLILVNHNYGVFRDIHTLRIYRRIIFRYLLAKATCVYHVNTILLDTFKHDYPRINTEVFDPFIPPTTQKCIDIREFYAPETVMFIESQQILIVAGAFRLSFHNGEDLYGFDMLIELISHLRHKLKCKIGLLFGLADSASNQDYYNTCIARMYELGLQDSIKVLENQQLLWPAISRADMLIRPTNTDGDPISIKEAVYFSVPVIASDCTVRHEKAILFKSRDQDSLNAVVHDCICEQCFLTRKLKAEA